MMLFSTFLIFASAVPIPQSVRPPSSDVVVKALPSPKSLPTQTSDARANVIQSRREYENAQQIARCALKMAPRKLRIILDGEVNSAHYRVAQRDIIFATISCNGYGAVRTKLHNVGSTSGGLGDIAGYKFDDDEATALAMVNLAMSDYPDHSAAGESITDRGALFEAALKAYVPELTLTPEQTNDLEVQQRFDMRELPRNRLRLPADRDYFQTAVCMVRVAPALAVALERSSAGSDADRTIQANLISDARVCVGNAKSVKVDSIQFRIYILDALYRWVVAARNVNTLMPSVTGD